MKKYKLKRWYPSLDSCWEVEDIAYYYRNGFYWNDTRVVEKIVSAKEVENNPDFWELIEEEKPLFITEDGVEIFDDTTEIISVSIKHHTVSKWEYRYLYKPLDCENFKHFGIEANAEKYIEENKPKPLFITEDGVEVFNQEEVYYVTDKLEKINSFINWFTIENMAKDMKIFKHESNADEYIWRNKRVFSYEDVVEWYGYGFKLGREGIYETLERLAIERSKQ